MNILIWNEYRHEIENEEVRKVYPEGIHKAIASFLEEHHVETATLDEAHHGLSDENLNKTDVLDADFVNEMTKRFKSFNDDVFAISCATGEGISEFLNHLYKKTDEIPHPENPLEIEYDEGFDDNDDSSFTVVKLNKNTFLTDGGKIRRLVSVTDTRNTQQMRRLANILDSMGVYLELKKMEFH